MTATPPLRAVGISALRTIPASSLAAPQVYNIQILRALAAMAVVIFHAESVLNAGGIQIPSLSFGASGVDLFFIISGFVMTYTTHSGVSAGEFARKRIVRVVPIYYLITLIVFVVSLTAPSLLQSTSSDPVQLIKSLLFIPFEKSNGLVQPNVFVGWTLNYEMAFYALFAVALLLPAYRMGFVLLFLAVTVSLHPYADGVISKFYSSPIILEFAAGIILGIFWRSRTNAKGGVLLIAAAVGLTVLLSGNQEMHRVLHYGLPYTFLVAGVLLLEGRFQRNRHLELLGNASYSIYLTHFFVTQAFAKIITIFDVAPGLTMIAFFVSIAVSGFAGVAFHKFVEAPISRFLSRLARKQTPSHRAAST